MENGGEGNGARDRNDESDHARIQSRASKYRHCGRSEAIQKPQHSALDCFVEEPVVGPRFARTRRLLAMTIPVERHPTLPYGSPAMARASPVNSRMCIPVLARSTI